MSSGSYNKATIIGHLGRDPEVKFTAGGKAVATISVATNERWLDGAGATKERTDWHRVVVWEKLAETCGKHLKSGDRALFEGRLQTRKWQNGEGKDQYATEIVAEKVLFLGGGKPDDGKSTMIAPVAESVPDHADVPF